MGYCMMDKMNMKLYSDCLTGFEGERARENKATVMVVESMSWVAVMHTGAMVHWCEDDVPDVGKPISTKYRQTSNTANRKLQLVGTQLAPHMDYGYGDSVRYRGRERSSTSATESPLKGTNSATATSTGSFFNC